MEYYLIKQDKRYPLPPTILGVFKAVDWRDICKERAKNIPDKIALFIEGNKDTQYLDLLDRQIFIVSEQLKKLLEKYEIYLKFKTIALIDNKNSKTKIYYLPIFDKVSCLSSKSEFNLDRSVIKKIVLEEEKIPDRSIFKLDGVTSNYIIVRLDLAESILRRDFKGISLMKVEIE